MNLDRRDFIRISALAAAVTGLGAVPPTVDTRNGMPYRALGTTGEQVSLLGVGGYHIAGRDMTVKDSVAIVRTAIDAGVNFMDNAYIYQNGRSEEHMGMALRDGYRDKVFLMTKFYDDERTVAGAEKQLEESLRRLQTDVIDLWQVHQVHKPEHPAAVYANGLPEFLLKAKESGKIRHFGFTGHSRPEWLVEMVEGGFAWETVQMPTNALDHHWTSFENSVMPLALKNNIAIIGMKALGGSPGQIVNRSKALTARECLHYAMNLPVSTLVSGMDSLEKLQENLDSAKAFKPLEQGEVTAILAKAQPVAMEGRFEPYKHSALA